MWKQTPHGKKAFLSLHVFEFHAVEDVFIAHTFFNGKEMFQKSITACQQLTLLASAITMLNNLCYMNLSSIRHKTTHIKRLTTLHNQDQCWKFWLSHFFAVVLNVQEHDEFDLKDKVIKSKIYFIKFSVKIKKVLMM